jgi:hypothetical protein
MRIRYLKPDFFTDEDIASLPYETRLFFQGLWCISDRKGRLEDKPAELKVKILPYDDVDPQECLAQLCGENKKEKEFIIRYSVNRDNYIQIINFEEHQKPHHTERESRIPAPDVKQIKPPGKPSTEPKVDFIQQLFEVYCEEYLLSRGLEYDKTAAGKEKKAIAGILTLYKQKNPQSNTEQALIDFKDLYKKCLSIKETWHYNNMSPSHIYSKFNQIKLIISGRNQKPGTQGRGTTKEQLRDIANGKFDAALDLQGTSDKRGNEQTNG